MMVQCDGLLLCMRGYCQYRKTNLALWNPVLRKLVWIKPSLCFTTSDYYGIRYDSKKSRYDYKILRFTDHRYDEHNASYEDEPQVEVYECKTNSWKTLAVEVDWGVYLSCKGAAVMGNMYWIACKDEEEYILGFDFSVERFKDVCFCPPPAFNNYLASYDGGDRLSLLQKDEKEPWHIVVWVTNNLAGDGDVLFTKYFNVSRPDVPALLDHTDTAYPVYFIRKQKRIMAWSEVEYEDDDRSPTCTVFYEIDEGGVRRQLETERHYEAVYFGTFLCGYVYVPSLVPLPE